MKFLILGIFTSFFSFYILPQKKSNYNLESYLTQDKSLDKKVEEIFESLNLNSLIGQLIMPACGRLGQKIDTIKALLNDQIIGGVLLLNGTKNEFYKWIEEYNKINKEKNNLPLLYSADAEPSLVNRKIIGSTPVSKANAISNLSQVKEVAEIISSDLNNIGINYNFAPVVDVAKNKTVGYRGFGSNPENIIPFSNAFIKQTQSQNIIATAKHFPGHGLVSGDTHKSLQIINGELKELKNYPPLINKGVLSIMVAHIAVKNNKEFNTNGAPATTSSIIVQDLLRDSLGFKGLIVTDAMNMGGVANYPNAIVKAIYAGCDIILMPKDTRKAHYQIKAEYIKNKTFKTKVNKSVRRIIRMKICLGII
ncbi:MAG: hypothetical protein CL844_02595 [Crocinitomicaceae bacterium]|nr:hypothetical protein [Crocinitomicaceae bacterium]|tara:strand:- start:55361 stop:56455 length:1095 start_codon:yes stop_codon:yes gene_type:complete